MRYRPVLLMCGLLLLAACLAPADEPVSAVAPGVHDLLERVSARGRGVEGALLYTRTLAIHRTAPPVPPGARATREAAGPLPGIHSVNVASTMTALTVNSWHIDSLDVSVLADGETVDRRRSWGNATEVATETGWKGALYFQRRSVPRMAAPSEEWLQLALPPDREWSRKEPQLSGLQLEMSELQDLQGFRCHRLSLRSRPSPNGAFTKLGTFWICPDRDYAIVRTHQAIRAAKGYTGALHLEQVEKFRREAGIWLPEVVREDDWTVPPNGAPVWDSTRIHTVDKCDLAWKPVLGALAPLPRPGCQITDATGAMEIVGGDLSAIVKSLRRGELPPPVAPPVEELKRQ